MIENADLEIAPFDSADYLTTPERCAAYLRVAFEEDDGDGKTVAHALGVLARAQGMKDLAERVGVNQQTLYRSLSSKGNPGFGTIMRITRALGYDLTPVQKS